MRKFHVTAFERKGLVCVDVFDVDHQNRTYFEVPNNGDRDMAYAQAKDLAGACIRQRVADETLTPPECSCTRGYVDHEGKVALCANEECVEYVGRVLGIRESIEATFDAPAYDNTEFKI